MPKPAKSQWDFGELFSVEVSASITAKTSAPEAVLKPVVPIRQVLTVGQLTTQVKRLLEKQVGEIWVTGEITNFRAQGGSGHLYFTLKDADSQLSCVLFRTEARESRTYLQDGRKVLLQGTLTVYEPRGQYQLIVTAVELQGVGALQVAFEKLKQQLNAEGLFAAERKRPLPRYPQRIGIVTSPTGAAIRDVLHVVQRRHSGLEMVLAPCRVQGQGAAEEIAAGIRLLNEFAGKNNPLDLILVTRGGGSLEDLWAFNEEVVARAIFKSKLPVVSAVGHEIDFTISDFVADVRAATPSAAAEIITEGVFSSYQFLASTGERLRSLVRQRLEDHEYEFLQVRQRLARLHPRGQINAWLQRLDELQDTMARCARQGAKAQQSAWRNVKDRLLRVRPKEVLATRRELSRNSTRRLTELARGQLREKQTRFKAVETRLRLLGPEQVLARGYSITMNAETGKVIRTASEVKAGQKLKTKVKTGEIRSVAGE